MGEVVKEFFGSFDNLVNEVKKLKSKIIDLEDEKEVTEEWIEEKAKIIYDHCKKWDLIDCKDFIRSII